MTGFVSSPPPPASPAGAEIACGPFWPDIDINVFRDSMRVGGQAIVDARIRQALLGAVITVDGELATWRTFQDVLGYASLADVPSPAIGGTKRNLHLWQRAVFAYAAADLIETHRDVTAAADGKARAETQAETPDDHRRNAIHAIRDIRGVNRTAVELI
ncbi:hypothetical protein C1T17_16490 [Sphingobium sp. SCG-1]|uniref:head completion/stabilization protein n=1 Tax=Sphingobium sp. SCG-1 TaxID=2072936 RepID=UPI000CD67602|nr:head completion/stabilization protein [Sphingobium sp. SCG-1]AUW59448.1 hypothetical protein C1T17_16490 [Sphingobium sp. SCG-1]